MAVAVFALGIPLVVVPALGNIDSLVEDPTKLTDVRTVVRTDADGRRTAETITSPRSLSMIERSLGPGGLLMLRMGIVAVAGFLAGAIVRNLARGNFPVEVGPVKVSEDAAAMGEKLEEGFEVLAADHDKAVAFTKALAAELDSAKVATRHALLAVNRELERIDARGLDSEIAGKLEEALDALALDHDQAVRALRSLAGEVDGLRTATHEGMRAITRELERLGRDRTPEDDGAP